MINERMTFHLKYGAEAEATAMWKEILEIFQSTSNSRDARIRFSTGLSGQLSVIVQDFLLKSLNDHNPMMYYWKINPKVQEVYARFVNLCDTSGREIFNIEHETGKTKNYQNMVTERYRFQLRFGKARDSIALWKEIMNEATNSGGPDLRLMSDVVGQSYILEVEAFYPNMCEVKPRREFWLANEKLKNLHAQFIPLCLSAERNFFAVDFDM